MQLKISSITSLTDARFFSAVGAHYLGFCFDVLNTNNISVEKAKEIIQWLHEQTIIGEFAAHQSREEIEFIAKEMQLDEIQIPFLHPQREALDFEKFLVTDDWHNLRDFPDADFLVISITDKDAADKELKDLIARHKVFIETNFTTTNILPLMETLQPYGIQITCKREEKAGLGAVDEYTELLELAGFS